jgi:hypothetical protein
MTDYDDRDDRPSWSEIDKRRDRSSHVRQDPHESRKKPSAHDEWIKKQYRKEIEKLFKGANEETEEQKKARMEIGRAYGTGKFNTVVRQYVKQHGLPADWSTLMLMLDHKDSPLVLQVLEALRTRLADSSEAEQEGFKSRLKIIAMTAADEALQECAEQMLEELNQSDG